MSSLYIEPFEFIQEAWKNGEDGITREQYYEVVSVLNVLKKWEWIAQIEPAKGIQFTDDPYFNLITSSVDMSNHTGFTMVFMFRKIKKVADVFIKREVHQCPICLSEDNNKFLMFECGHKFHSECIIHKGVKTCPLCRRETVPEHLQ